MTFTHLGPEGEARMVDVSAKPETDRMAVAHAFVRMKPETAAKIAKLALPRAMSWPWRAWPRCKRPSGPRTSSPCAIPCA